MVRGSADHHRRVCKLDLSLQATKQAALHGLGGYPAISLALARERAGDHRKLVKNGQDPMDVNVEQVQAAKATPSFTSCAARYIMSHRHSWRNVKHARQWVSTLKAYARPVIGSMPVDEITTQDVLKILSLPSWPSFRAIPAFPPKRCNF
ncbi:phage integrase central domain-containing protein [Onishia taeanensis]|uniref:phage integrase central domain-containing protein n=1 Tax=Onishia taeanensis TaxID=284577 RepID=UPI003C7DE220